MPDYGEGHYEKVISREYERWSDEDLHRMINDTNAEMNGLKLAKNHLESLISANYAELNNMLFELRRRSGMVPTEEG